MEFDFIIKVLVTVNAGTGAEHKAFRNEHVFNATLAQVTARRNLISIVSQSPCKFPKPTSEQVRAAGSLD